MVSPLDSHVHDDGDMHHMHGGGRHKVAVPVPVVVLP